MTGIPSEAVGFWRWASEHPDQPAVIQASDGVTTSFGELAGQVNRISHGLRALGLGPGDALAALLPNRAEYLALMLATSQVGVYLVPINRHLTAAEIVHIVADSGAPAFIADAAFA